MEGQTDKKQTDKNIVYLIEEIWLDGIEDKPSLAVGYEPFGFTPDEEVAKSFCAKGRDYTRKDCWAISYTMPEYRYKKLKEI